MKLLPSGNIFTPFTKSYDTVKLYAQNNPWVPAVTKIAIVVGSVLAIAFSVSYNGFVFKIQIGGVGSVDSSDSLDLSRFAALDSSELVNSTTVSLPTNVKPTDDLQLHSTSQIAKLSHAEAAQAYIAKYKDLVIEECRIHNTLPSVKMAQAMLESNFGRSRLASKHHNHFGVKCKSKCVGCTCTNYKDDSVYDMFRVFDSDWYSFREHSKLMTNERYGSIPKQCGKDYKCWANELQRRGYATDKRYAEAIMSVIKRYKLDSLDAELSI